MTQMKPYLGDLQSHAHELGTSDPTLNELFDMYGSDKGTRVAYLPNDERAHNYGPFYERMFAPLRYEPIRLLEIGLNAVNNANIPSLLAWRDWFPRGSIVGFDCHDFRQHTQERIAIAVGNQANPEHLARLAAEGPYDIIIDDGSHNPTYQRISFEALFGSVRPGGFYAIEDLSISGRPHWLDFDSTPMNIFLESLHHERAYPVRSVSWYINRVWCHKVACIEKER